MKTAKLDDSSKKWTKLDYDFAAWAVTDSGFMDFP